MGNKDGTKYGLIGCIGERMHFGSPDQSLRLILSSTLAMNVQSILAPIQMIA